MSLDRLITMSTNYMRHVLRTKLSNILFLSLCKIAEILANPEDILSGSYNLEENGEYNLSPI